MEYCVLKCYFGVEDLAILDDDLSSAIRGIWGMNLKRSYCLQRNINCKDCTFEQCPYYAIFEKRYGTNDEYRPYIIYHNQNNKKQIEVHFILLGFLSQHYDKVLLPILQIEERPLRLRGRRHFITLDRIIDQNNKIILDRNNRDFSAIKASKMEASKAVNVEKIVLHFETPLRMKYQGRFVGEFNFEVFLNALIRRLKYIQEHFTEDEHIYSLKPEFLQSQIKHDFKWKEKVRKSNRQGQKMSIGGLIGSLVIEKPHPELVEILQIGEYIQVGKQTSFGNGKYYIEMESTKSK